MADLSSYVKEIISEMVEKNIFVIKGIKPITT
jgi:hypothetical protein